MGEEEGGHNIETPTTLLGGGDNNKLVTFIVRISGVIAI